MQRRRTNVDPGRRRSFPLPFLLFLGLVAVAAGGALIWFGFAGRSDQGDVVAARVPGIEALRVDRPPAPAPILPPTASPPVLPPPAQPSAIPPPAVPTADAARPADPAPPAMPKPEPAAAPPVPPDLGLRAARVEPVTLPPAAPFRPQDLPPEPAKALAALLAAAGQGHAAAQLRLGRAYLEGAGTAPDKARALAWFMQAAARGEAAAVQARDEALASFDDTTKVQADSLSRSLAVPMPAGWITDAARGIRAWSPSWYRNGTFKIAVEGAAVDGLLHGPAKVHLTATLYGRSDRSFEGTFVRGILLDERLRDAPELVVELLESDEIRIAVPLPAGAPAGIARAWRQTKLKDMRIEACPAATPHLFLVAEPGFAGTEDAAVKAAALAAVQALGAFCRLDPTAPVQVTLLPPEHAPAFDRGDTVYRPRLAHLQLYGFDQAPERWSVQISNFAREVQQKQAQEAEQQRKRAERDQKKAREIAAAMLREMPDIRGFKLGIGFDEFKKRLAPEAASWEPKLRDDHRMPDFTTWRQKVNLKDGSSFTGIFASAQNRSQLVTLSYEQHLREGPEPEAMRAQLYAKYGKADEEAGQGTFLTWWLRSALDNEPTGAFLRGRLQTDPNRRVNYLALTLNDYNLARRDEVQAADARRAAEREAFEKKKSEKPKF